MERSGGGQPISLRVEDLTVEMGAKRLVQGLDLTIRPGQSWAVLGRNGVGKSSLIHTLAGLHPPTGGRIWLGAEEMGRIPRRRVARQVGLLFQQEANGFPASVMETALTGRFPHLSEWQGESAEDYRLAWEALKVVRLQALADRRCQTLSGGEMRRLDLAVLLVQDPNFFLLDEPANHLDLHYQILLLDHFRRLTREREKSLFMALHDMNLAARFSDHCLLLYDSGQFEAGPSEEMLTADKLSRLFGHPVNRWEREGRVCWLAG